MNKSNNVLSCEVEKNTKNDTNVNIQESSNDVCKNVIKILISEDYIISNIRRHILQELNIVDESIRIKVGHLIGIYINSKTEFFYNKDKSQIIGIKLEQLELQKFISKLIIFQVEDKYLSEKKEINQEKTLKLSSITKLDTNLKEKKDNLKFLILESYRLESVLHRLSDTGKDIGEVERNLDDIEGDIELEDKKIQELSIQKKNIKSEIMILINRLLLLDEQEENEINRMLEKNTDELIKISFNYELKEENKLGGDNKGNIISLGGGKKIKNIIYSLAFIAGLGASINFFSERSENMQINEDFTNSMNLKIQKEIEKKQRIEKIASLGSPRIISGYEDYFIVGVDKYPLEIVYLGETPSEDIILSQILVTFLDKNGIKQKPKTLGVYFYYKDITDKQFVIIVNDNSAEGQTINLTIKK